jgi:hypothetical protein
MDTKTLLTCPKCLQATGKVRRAGTVAAQPEVMRLTLGCQTCQHEWVTDKDTESSADGYRRHEG